VPGGDARSRIYGIGGHAGLLAIEIENDSPAPFVVAFVLRPSAPDGQLYSLAVHGTWVVADGRPILRTLQKPRRWAVSQQGRTFDVVATGDAPAGPFPTTRSRAGTLAGAFLHPLAHRAKLRACVVIGLDAAAPLEASDPELLPTPSQAVLGWKAQLDRGMHVMVPDERLQTAIDAARAALLLSAANTSRPTPGKFIALEDWGFDREGEVVWKQLGSRDRRRANQRNASSGAWDEVRRMLVESSPTFSWPDGPSGFLHAMREVLVREYADGRVALLPEFPLEWVGHSVEVHDVPTRRGLASFALRWHGARPALLWECTSVLRVTCPALDPGWSSDEPRGDALLAPHRAAGARR
jgi:hypothetical protein